MSKKQKSQGSGDEHRTFYRCFVCDLPFQFGPHAYHGRVVQGCPGQMICSQCERSNWDGIVPTPQLENKFREKGIKPEYNAKGYIVIPQ